MDRTPIDRRRLLQFGIAATATLGAPGLRAQPAWPTKPIRFVVPFAPGGSSEIIARATAAEMGKLLGQSVYVDNQPGGAGNVAMTDVSRADDQHTLILGHIGTFAVNPFIFEKLSFDVNKDFKPVSLLAKVPSLYLVNPEVPAKNLVEFIALAKKKPGQLNYGSAGNGSAGHLAMEYLKLVTGTHIVHIPYRGTGPQLQDLLAGRTEASSAGTPPLLPHVRDGRLKAIAVGMSERIAALPDVGTVAEQGYPGFETSQWYGLIAPAGTPPEVVQKIAQHATQALRSGPITARFANDNALGAGGTPADFARFIQKEQERWSRVVRQADIRLD